MNINESIKYLYKYGNKNNNSILIEAAKALENEIKVTELVKKNMSPYHQEYEDRIYEGYEIIAAPDELKIIKEWFNS